MKRITALLLALLVCSVFFPSLALGDESTSSPEPTGSIEPEPEPYSADAWTDGEIDSREWPGAPRDPEWILWVLEVGGLQPNSGGGINLTLRKAGRLYQDAPDDGLYRFRTSEHDIMLEAQVGFFVSSGEPLTEPLTIELIDIEFGLEQASSPSAEPAPARPAAARQPVASEPYLPFTGPTDTGLGIALVSLLLGLALRHYAARARDEG